MAVHSTTEFNALNYSLRKIRMAKPENPPTLISAISVTLLLETLLQGSLAPISSSLRGLRVVGPPTTHSNKIHLQLTAQRN